ncbi:MbnH family di-heme enzyme [Aliikangiella coralliicola]|uniref:Di-heme enzyme n=1 Tax=Aliikangiella coralliicola TaxID=2592383 RepID=A0A545UK30_9GAMM|nr:MbnH family di-heme enzyme [Aliikangiella coralliicola]TQV89825.1 di-heme enzyme [Aliikangiella coralliicola]
MKKITRLALGTFICCCFVFGCGQENLEVEYNWNLRQGFPLPQVPANNPMTKAKVELGRHLFYDTNLSFNQTQSCASCHQQNMAFAESLFTSIGSTGEIHRRNSPALVNIAYNKTLTWAHDGLTSIEQQILLPMFGEEPVELGITGHENEVLARFNTQSYSKLFSRAFPGEKISFELINKALSSFVRSLISLNSPFDVYAYDGDDSALDQSAINGMTLFFSEKLECHHCHGGFNFTQSTSHEKQLLDRRPFHNTGLYNVLPDGGYPKIDTGLSEITLNPLDDGRFRAPTLRNIAMSAPYMHDGSIATLEDVIDFYAAGGRNIDSGDLKGDGRQNPLKNSFVKGFEITEQEKKDLLAFLNSLTDQTFLTNPEHAAPVKKETGE